MNLFQEHGAQPNKQPRYVPIFLPRMFEGIWTQRSVLHDPASIVESKFYGGKPGALIAGSNVELTNNLTLKRRPGLSQFSIATYPTPPDRCFSFQLTDGTIRVIVDTTSTPVFNLSQVQEISGVSYYLFSSPQSCAANNSYAGLIFQVAGFDNGLNNGTFTCIGSTSTYLILNNAFGSNDTHAGTAVSSGAVYWDQQNTGVAYPLSAVQEISDVSYYIFTTSQSGGNNNGFSGDIFNVTGFDQTNNNGTFVCLGSTSSYLILENPLATNDTHSGTATSTDKVLLFAKSPGAGQAYFVAVAGVLYIGDGVDVRKYTPLNPNGTIWNWGSAPPTTQPSVSIVSSGSAAISWVASTVFSTMGLLVDPNNNVEQLFSVNGLGNNPPPATLGFSGNGAPAFNTATGATTNDGSVVWTSQGPITLWTANTLYASGAAIYDPTTNCIFVESHSSSRTSGPTKPAFNSTLGINGARIDDTNSKGVGGGNARWECLGTVNGSPTVVLTWAKNTAFNAYSPPSSGSDPSNTNAAIVFPLIPSNANLTAYAAGTGPAIYLLGATTAGTTANTNYTPWTGITSQNPGAITFDNQLQWLNLGSATWAALTPYSAWTAQGSVFSCIKDPNGNMQVCTTGGTSGATIPAIWQTSYGGLTQDGGVTWTCVGPPVTWTVNTQWDLPIVGFAPPSKSEPFGGAEVIGSGFVQAVISSGLSGTVQPTWPTSGTSFTLTSAQNAIGGITAYIGTITGGDHNAFAGLTFQVAGFDNAANNGTFVCFGSSHVELRLKNTSGVADTHAATATELNNVIGDQTTDNGITWETVAPFSQNSLSWQFGHVYAYSYEARLTSDPSNTTAPPGLSTPLGPPTGSETGLITTASPVFTITGANAGAVNTVSGIGSTDPQIDTIVIWRDADGGGADNMFFLTEIPAPPPVGGVAQPWSFADFLPDVANSTFPGLDNLIPAPIDEENNPPPNTFLPMIYNFQTIWGANGSNVPFSGGPNVITGNPNESFNPADNFPYLAPVTRVVKTSQGSIVFLTDSVEIIAGGPTLASFYSVTLAPGIGMLSYNALDVYAGDLYFISSDSELKIINPSLQLSNAGFPIGDQLALLNPSKVYLAVQQAGVDNAFYVADGSTGWWRCNPRQVPGDASGPNPVWSPFATITGGAGMVQSVETAPGIKTLLVGGTGCNQHILKRDLTVFTDAGTPYDAQFTMGAIMLAHQGELALLKFLAGDFSGVSYRPQISYLLDELTGTFVNMPLVPVFDPPSLYGTTIRPQSYSPNRYYFAATGSLARCRFLQIRCDFGTTSNPDEIFDVCIFGRFVAEG